MSWGRVAALCVACGIAGLFFAVLLSATPAGAQEGTTGTVTTVTGTETTTTAPPTTAPPTTTAPAASRPKQRKRVGPRLIQPGVTIGGVLVGGLTVAEARRLVEERFSKRMTLVVSPTRKLRVEPRELGAAARLGKAVKLAARVRQQSYAVPLSVEVPTSRLESSSVSSARRRVATPWTRA